MTLDDVEHRIGWRTDEQLARTSGHDRACRHRWCRWVPVLHGAWAERASPDRDGARRLLARTSELPEHGPEGGGSRQRRLEPVERRVRRTREAAGAVSERPDVPVRRSDTCQVN